MVSQSIAHEMGEYTSGSVAVVRLGYKLDGLEDVRGKYTNLIAVVDMLLWHHSLLVTEGRNTERTLWTLHVRGQR